MIGFDLTEQQERIKAEAAEFAARVIAPRAAGIDEADEAPVDIWQAMSRLPYQYTGMSIPAAYGGCPRSILDQVIIIEEVTTIGKSPACTILMQITGLGTAAIVNNASEELKKKYLPVVASGKKMGAYALTEYGTGSDAAALKCQAVKQKDAYVINGQKYFTSFAHQSSHIILFAQTQSDGENRGISAFIVPVDAPGFKIVRRVPCMGLRGHREEELEFKNCCIPQENLIGEEGKGLSYALRSLDQTRTTLNAGFIGLARACLEESINHARARKTFGKELYHRQSLSFPLAEVAARIDAARLMNYQAAWLHDRGRRHTVETAKAKTLATRVMLEAADLAVEIHGGGGCITGNTIERYYRDARIWSFAQGTPEMMDYLISRELFGKYEM
jgi:alkylation response protein AidB-like acyl-CoA dehydrogenase